MNLKNIAMSKVPSMISQWRMPCLRDSAGRIPGGSRYVNLYSMDDAITLTFSLDRRRLSM